MGMKFIIALALIAILPACGSSSPQSASAQATGGSPGAGSTATMTGTATSTGTATATQVQAPAAIAYSSGQNYLPTGTTMSAIGPTVTGGVPTVFSVAPALPAGLSLDSQTGVISGTPLIGSSFARYTVTASNSSGSVNASVSIDTYEADYTTTNSSGEYCYDLLAFSLKNSGQYFQASFYGTGTVTAQTSVMQVSASQIAPFPTAYLDLSRSVSLGSVLVVISPLRSEANVLINLTPQAVRNIVAAGGQLCGVTINSAILGFTIQAPASLIGPNKSSLEVSI